MISRVRFGSAGIVAGALAAAACQQSARPEHEIDGPVRAQMTTSGEMWLVLKGGASRGAGLSVGDTLKRSADSAQGGLRARLHARQVRHRAFWIVNAILVDADAATLDSLRADPAVERILPDRLLPPSRLIPAATLEASGSSGPGTASGVSDVAAPSVWSSYGARGEGMVVASIDTGVDLNHPALVRQYRGRNADGSFSHDYNWFDPTRSCFSDGPAGGGGVWAVRVGRREFGRPNPLTWPRSPRTWVDLGRRAMASGQSRQTVSCGPLSIAVRPA